MSLAVVEDEMEKMLRYARASITGQLLLLLRELCSADCAGEIARHIMRRACHRYWHFRLIALACDWYGWPTEEYSVALLTGGLVDSVVLLFPDRLHCDSFVQYVTCSGLLVHGYIHSDVSWSKSSVEYTGYAALWCHRISLSCHGGTIQTLLPHKGVRIHHVTMHQDPFRCHYWVRGVHHVHTFLEL